MQIGVQRSSRFAPDCATLTLRFAGQLIPYSKTLFEHGHAVLKTHPKGELSQCQGSESFDHGQ